MKKEIAKKPRAVKRKITMKPSTPMQKSQNKHIKYRNNKMKNKRKKLNIYFVNKMQ
jgi:hypothetical protein